MKNTYYVTCQLCGSNLDPGERCDCNEEGKAKRMTPSEKARETRKRNAEKRKTKEKEAMRIRETKKKSCLSILEDSRLTPSERLEALKILHELTERR